MGSEDDSLNVPTHERMAHMATVQGAARRFTAEGAGGAELGQAQSVPLEQARATIESWPESPKKTAEVVLEHYGPPNEATPTKLFWYRKGPWSRMELTADELVHRFPTPHTDFFTQWVDYPVPPEKAAELAAFDGSVIVDRTAGEIAARCDQEAYNVLTLNLAVEIIEGERTVDDARRLYAETAAAYVMGRPAPYAEKLLFTPAHNGAAAYPDDPMIGGAMAHQSVEKLKDAVGAGKEPE
jgi:hypothetical protein